MKVNSFSAKGVKGTQVSLPKTLVEEGKLATLAQAVHVQQDRDHVGFAKTKTRSDINRTKKKWYRQKGTGGARHGARSAHIFVGGGVAHGPTGEKRTLTLPVNIKRKALRIAVYLKAKDGKVVVISTLSAIKKTKEAQTLLNKLSKATEIKKNPKLLLALSSKSWGKAKTFKNIKSLNVMPFKDLNARDVWLSSLLVIDKEAL